MPDEKLKDDKSRFGFLIGVIKVVIKAIVIMVLVGLFIKAVQASYSFGYSVFQENPVDSESEKVVTFRIWEDSTMSEVADALEEQNLIKDSKVFLVQAVFFETELHPGDFELSPSMTVKDILDIIGAPPEKAEP